MVGISPGIVDMFVGKSLIAFFTHLHQLAWMKRRIFSLLFEAPEASLYSQSFWYFVQFLKEASQVQYFSSLNQESTAVRMSYIGETVNESFYNSFIVLQDFVIFNSTIWKFSSNSFPKLFVICYIFNVNGAKVYFLLLFCCCTFA